MSRLISVEQQSVTFTIITTSRPWYYKPLYRVLRPGRQCCQSTALAFRQPSTTCSTSLSSQHLRPPCLFSCRPHIVWNSARISSGTRPSVQSVSESF